MRNPVEVPKNADRERVLKSLRAIIDAPGTSSRALAAKYAASMRLAKLTGMDVEPEPQVTDVTDVNYQHPDPFDDLTEMEFWRVKRARK